MSSHVYEIMKTIYSTPASESTDSARISVLQNTLSQLRLANIATLDALMTHFTRLIELTSADEAYISELATILAPCILRPKTETSMTMEEKYSYRLIRDLFAHKDAIFSELKRASSLNSASNIDTRRPRAISTDESNRRANMEARQKAIIAAGGARSRATSPAPSPRGHRRDRSSGPPAAETRFPVQTSPTATTDSTRNSRGSVRQSLEVPSSAEASPVVEPKPSPLSPLANGTEASTPSVTSATYMPGSGDGMEEAAVEKRTSLASVSSLPAVEKRNSLGRGGQVSRNSIGRKPYGNVARMSKNFDMVASGNRDSVGSIGEVPEPAAEQKVGVSLEDKPMDD